MRFQHFIDRDGIIDHDHYFFALTTGLDYVDLRSMSTI